jgi:hypothetical protein
MISWAYAWALRSGKLEPGAELGFLCTGLFDIIIIIAVLITVF